ncbi:unnamed protein product [Linum tenue]|uniref:Uncharacterized protein n=1 Tax=Linum tenue TaxID=586396 RepID=A0AAV0PZS0_9ROSI|nr:unnamed protein product [Linum tenue]
MEPIIIQTRCNHHLFYKAILKTGNQTLGTEFPKVHLRILVIEGAGFLGSNLVHKLMEN